MSLRGVVVAGFLFVMGAVALAPSKAAANETDPWYAWVHPPRDGTEALNRAINERFEYGLSFTNGDMTCRQAAARMTNSMRTAAFFFFLGDLSTWKVDYSPRTASEYFNSSSTNGAYRHIYGLMPLDPAMRSGDILFGTDKLGHFFTNGLRHYDTYVEARKEGADDDEAMRRAIEDGIREEKTWLGLYPSGIFSFADLEANYQGLRFFRELCDGDSPALILVDDKADDKAGKDGEKKWTLRTPFDIQRYVSPCWDEAYRPNYFGRAANAAKRGLREMCSELARPDVHQRLSAYRARGCDSASTHIVDALVRAGELPDPSPWSFARICADGRAVGE